MLLCRLFFSCGGGGLLSCHGFQASHCGGFSCCVTGALGKWPSVAVASGLYNIGFVAPQHVGSLQIGDQTCISCIGRRILEESACQYRDRRDSGSIPGLGRSPGGGNGNPIQYSCLENPMNRGGQWVITHGVAKSQTQLSTHTYTHTSKTPLLLLKSEKKNFKQLLFFLCFFPDYTHLKVLPTFRNLSCISFLLVFAIPFCPVIQTVSRPSP